MQTHEHYEDLCALAAIGQLSADEHHDLFEHLRGCGLCRRAADDYAVILDQLPSATPPEVTGDTEELLSKSYRQKFVQRAVSAGARFTPEAGGLAGSSPSGFRLPIQRKWFLIPIAATALGMLVLGAHFGMPQLGKSSLDAGKRSISGSDRTPGKATEPRNEIPGAHQATAPSLRDLNSDKVSELAALKQQLSKLIHDRDATLAESEHLKQQMAILTSQSEKSEQAVSEAKVELEKAKNDEADILAALVAKENRIEELSGLLTAQAATVEREQQLSAAAGDVRELMGARSLHMIDVYDFDTRGKRDKSFGRVFYTEGKSLIFYAFDLAEKNASSKVTFQAWGQREGGAKDARNLGVFYVDDRAQKRWVLRVDDPKLLSSIDSVFVTVEPSPGRDRPSGKKLLYAFLGTPANHP